MNLISNNIVIALLLALGVAAGWIWKAIPEPKVPGSAAVAAEQWELPAEAEGDLKQSATVITERNLWGTVVAAKDMPLNDPEWRFAGVVRNGEEYYVLISIDNKPAEIRKIGDTLPGGSKILKISEDRICILIEGKRRALGIYRR
ncbi:MAG: type II secretion system protein N [Sulfurimicrobium sp.]|nr:type II secretion system protein N [Sulfurimicrobium sp.]